MPAPVIRFHKAHNLGHRTLAAGEALDWSNPQDCAFFQRQLRWSAAAVEFPKDSELQPHAAGDAPAADPAAPTAAPKGKRKA